MTSRTIEDAATSLRNDIANQAADEVGADVAARCAGAVAQSMLEASKELERLKGGAEDLPPEKREFTLGWMCGHFGVMPDVLRELARRAGAAPCRAINDVVYFDATAVVTIADFIRKYREATGK